MKPFGRSLGRCILWAAVLAARPQFLPAQCPQTPLLATLANPTQAAQGNFGYPVAVSGNRAIVGNRFANPAGQPPLAGSAHLLNARTGELIANLTSPTPYANGFYGWTVGISGDLAMVFVRDSDDFDGRISPGIIHVYNAANGALVRSLVAPDAGDFDNFGQSMATSGNLIVAGAADNNIDGLFDVGNAHVFDLTTGALVSSLANPSPEQSDYFANAVGIDAGRVIASATRDEVGRDNHPGQVYIFDAATGNLLRELTNPAPALDQFGIAVAISGDLALVGAAEEIDNSTGLAGAVHVFNAATGEHLRTIACPPTADGQKTFGSSLAIQGRAAVLGLSGYSPTINAIAVGAVYVFDATTGELKSTIQNPTPADGDQFGASVGIDLDVIVAGAPSDKPVDPGFRSGTAYSFECLRLLPIRLLGHLLGEAVLPPAEADLNRDGAIDVADLIQAI